MALIRLRRNGSDTPQETPATEPLIVEEGAPRKKAGPTPTRREAEKARMERLHPQLTPKQQRAADQAARNARTNAGREAIERRPERVLLRNFIDHGWHVGEFAMPVFLVLIALTFVTARYPNLVLGITIAMWIMLIGVVIDVAVTWRRAKKLLRERLGTTDFRTLFTYTMNRVISIRRFRSPAPVIKRGEPY